MLKIENTEVVGWEHAIRGMRNPMNSWDKSDSKWVTFRWFDEDISDEEFQVGGNDLELMKKLSNAGSDHSKYLRMITVYVDIVAPLYFWKEFDTYKVGTVRNSCSTMHKIQAKEFIPRDFSFENLTDSVCGCALDIIEELNKQRILYLDSNDKKYWWNMIQLLPSSYNQKSTVMMNYQVLKNIYHSRKNHKLDEWHTFCHWIEELPYAEEVITT